MTRKEQISALATKLGLVNDPVTGLDENDLTIARLEFFNDDGTREFVEMTDQNKAGRLFFQQFSNQGLVLLPLHEMLREEAKKFFAELWEEEPNPARKLIYALRTFEWVKIHLK